MSDFDEAMAVTMHAYEQIASSYADHHTAATLSDFWKERMQRFARTVRENPLYQEQPSLPILDAGCGPGRDALLLAQMGFEVLAVDLSEAMLTEARCRCQQQPEAQHITFRQMDMRALQLPDASCAGVWASASFLHIPKKENLTVLKELLRVLVFDGPIMVIVKEDDGGELERYDVHEQSGMLRFYARYRGSELWALLEQAGVQVLEMTTTIDTRFANSPRWLGALGVK